jgi:hypothetical protein
VSAPKPIETFYNGITYRSKLEACWAAFFDGLHLRHEYEIDAFTLAGVGNYTPDFWLPDVDSGNGMWVEIKGRNPKRKERQKCMELANETGRKTCILVGQPMRHIRAAIGEDNAYLYHRDATTTIECKLSNLLGVLAPSVSTYIIHHAAVTAHEAVRWYAGVVGKVNKANKTWSKRRR